MLYNYEPVVKTTIAFLQLLRVKVNNTTVNETLQGHPDWPSLLSISDSLKKWNVPNAAGRIEPEEIDALPLPFLAHIRRKEEPIVAVTSVSETQVSYRSSANGKTVIEDKPEFITKWNGVYLIAEPDGQSGEKEYERNRQQAFLNLLTPAALLLLLTIFSVLGFNRLLQASTRSLFYPWTLFITLFAGVTVTALLLWYEMDRNNPLLQKVCTGIAKGNCNAILTGKAAKLFNLVSWSEIGFFYFSGGLLLLVSTTQLSSLAIVSLFNLLALPYIFFSVYYQWRVAKQWCVLCLAVQTLLLAGGLTVISGSLYAYLPEVTVQDATRAFSIYAAPVLIWFIIKPYIKKLQEGKTTNREYLRIKFNSEIFETLLKKQKQLTTDTTGLGITIGNPDAANTLIKVCNPYCGPCSAAHPKIEKLLEESPNLSVRIIFTARNDKANPAYQPVSHLLAIAEKNNMQVTQQALDDWYLAKEKNYPQFAAKYPMNGELEKQGQKIEAMDNWCNKNSIQATPTLFINGYQLPDAYSVEDLQYFLLE